MSCGEIFEHFSEEGSFIRTRNPENCASVDTSTQVLRKKVLEGGNKVFDDMLD